MGSIHHHWLALRLRLQSRRVQDWPRLVWTVVRLELNMFRFSFSKVDPVTRNVNLLWSLWRFLVGGLSCHYGAALENALHVILVALVTQNEFMVLHFRQELILRNRAFKIPFYGRQVVFLNKKSKEKL